MSYCVNITIFEMYAGVLIGSFYYLGLSNSNNYHGSLFLALINFSTLVSFLKINFYFGAWSPGVFLKDMTYMQKHKRTFLLCSLQRAVNNENCMCRFNLHH